MSSGKKPPPYKFMVRIMVGIAECRHEIRGLKNRGEHRMERIVIPHF